MNFPRTIQTMQKNVRNVIYIFQTLLLLYTLYTTKTPFFLYYQGTLVIGFVRPNLLRFVRKLMNNRVFFKYALTSMRNQEIGNCKNTWLFISFRTSLSTSLPDIRFGLTNPITRVP